MGRTALRRSLRYATRVSRVGRSANGGNQLRDARRSHKGPPVMARVVRERVSWPLVERRLAEVSGRCVARFAVSREVRSAQAARAVRLLLLPLFLMRHVEHILQFRVRLEQALIEALEDGEAMYGPNGRGGVHEIM